MSPRRAGCTSVWARWCVVALTCWLGAVVLGCGSDEQPSHHDAGADAGVACAPGEAALDGGGCQRAGIPPGSCAAGFAPGEGAVCDPILPATSCEKGQMAVPGDTQCRAVMPCGSDVYGDAPVDASTQFVNGAYQGGGSNGKKDTPWTTIQDAVLAASSGALIAIAPGQYAGSIVVSAKPVRIWGRCPSLVQIVGDYSAPAAVQIRSIAASGTELVGVAIRGTGGAVLVTGAKNVVLDRLWIHDTSAHGVDGQDDLGATQLRVVDSLIEATVRAGVALWGTDASIEATVIRGVAADPSDPASTRGISIDDDPGVRPTLALQRSVLEDNGNLGIAVDGADATIEAVVVRGTREVVPQLSGTGLSVIDDPTTGSRANVSLHTSVIDGSEGAGILVRNSTLDMDTTVVRDTKPEPSDNAYGRGIEIQDHLDASLRAAATIRSSVVERSHDIGIFVLGSDATVESTIVRDTTERVSDGTHGEGVIVQERMESHAAASAVMRSSRIEHNLGSGVLATSATLRMETTFVGTTQPWTDGTYGDGIAALAYDLGAQLDVIGCRIEATTRAGVAVFGAEATLSATSLECSPIDLDGEPFGAHSPSIEDGGGNTCGCSGAMRPCQVLSSGLMAPRPLDP